MITRKRIIISFTIAMAAGVAWWLMATSSPISKGDAQIIATRALMGADTPPPHVPVHVEDRDQAFAVFFTFPVPGGHSGETYRSYAVIHKENGEVLELGVTPPEE